jgi:hypothetical protein
LIRFRLECGAGKENTDDRYKIQELFHLTFYFNALFSQAVIDLRAMACPFYMVS